MEEVARYCHHTHSGFCRLCGSSNPGNSNTASSQSPPPSTPQTSSGRGVDGGFQHWSSLVSCYLPRLILALISGTLTGLFALAGAFTGAITGALAGRASDCGVLRGAGLGAVAGAVLSVEVLEASRAYWCSERSTSQSSPSMADFVDELLQGRLVREQLAPTAFIDYSWQVRVANISYARMQATYDRVLSRGLSAESLEKLPHHVITDEGKTRLDGSSCCSICLQDFEVGETVRSLRRCHHMFHLTCVDKWLLRHDSCPVCRQSV